MRTSPFSQMQRFIWVQRPTTQHLTKGCRCTGVHLIPPPTRLQTSTTIVAFKGAATVFTTALGLQQDFSQTASCISIHESDLRTSQTAPQMCSSLVKAITIQPCSTLPLNERLAGLRQPQHEQTGRLLRTSLQRRSESTVGRTIQMSPAHCTG